MDYTTLELDELKEDYKNSTPDDILKAYQNGSINMQQVKYLLAENKSDLSLDKEVAKELFGLYLPGASAKANSFTTINGYDVTNVEGETKLDYSVIAPENLNPDLWSFNAERDQYLSPACGRWKGRSCA